MTQPGIQDELAALRAAYPTPEATAQGMRRELEAFEATLRRAAAHWGEPMPGRTWTPAQEAEHTILVNEGVGRLVRLLLSGKPLREVPHQPGRVEKGRRVAPPGTEPGPGEGLEELLARHAATFPLLAGVRAEPDPERTWPHAFLGRLDALDWLRMAAWQTGHHRRTLGAGLDRLEAGERVAG